MSKITILLLIVFFISIKAERDYYEILGLNRDASESDIKKAYKKLAMQYHPDKNKEEGAEQMFMEVTNAYQVLSDPENRKKYDTFGHAAFKQGGGGGGGGQGMKFDFGDPFDIFKSFFGGGFGGGGEGMKFSFNFGGDGGGGDHFGGGFPFGQAGPGRKQARQTQQQQQQRQPLYQQNTDVTLLTEETFQRHVHDTGNAWLIKFFLQDCQHCHELAPTYEKVASSLKHIVNVGAVDCSKQKQLCDKFKVQSVPVLILIPHGKENRENYRTYDKEKTPTKIYDFALTALPQDYVTVMKFTQEYNQFMDVQKPKIILFSKKNSVPPLFTSLSLFFKDYVKFGFISRSSATGRQLDADRSVTEWPEIVGYSADNSEKQVYSGEVTYPSLSIFVNKVYKSKKAEPAEQKLIRGTADNFKSICTAKHLCGIFLAENGNEDLTDDEQSIVKSLSTKYSREKSNFVGFWLGKENSELLREGISAQIKFILYNPKSLKIAWTAEKSMDGISGFLDRVFGGAEKWIKLESEIQLKA